MILISFDEFLNVDCVDALHPPATVIVELNDPMAEVDRIPVVAHCRTGRLGNQVTTAE
jgi:hypothetical protein